MTADATASPTISVIIPTTCEFSRQSLIERAINSVLTQEGVSAELVVVVNGDRFDADLLRTLRSDHRLSVLYVEEGHVSRARLHGLTASTGDFFGFLDDDDELLPQALRLRLDQMLADPCIDVLVTNGLIHEAVDVVHVPDGFEAEIHDNPGLSFLRHNWFASPASMFRRATVESEIFDISHRYFEWTYLFFRLLSRAKQIRYSGAITYRKHEDNPLSVSRSREYQLALPAMLRDLIGFPLRQELRRVIKKRYVAALNANSTLHLAERDFPQAIAFHVQCLRAGGWQYIPYTRSILVRALRR